MLSLLAVSASDESTVVRLRSGIRLRGQASAEGPINGTLPDLIGCSGSIATRDAMWMACSTAGETSASCYRILVALSSRPTGAAKTADARHGPDIDGRLMGAYVDNCPCSVLAVEGWDTWPGKVAALPGLFISLGYCSSSIPFFCGLCEHLSGLTLFSRCR